MTDTALVSASQASSLIVTPDQYTAKLQQWSQRYHVLAPFSQISGLAPQHGLMYTAVTINPDPKSLDGDVYDNAGGKLPWLKDGERALAKRGLRKLAEAQGISVTTERVDPRTIPNYWEVKATATYRGLDGATVVRESTMDWDLRDGSPRIKGFSPNQISEARKNGLRNCETRAINAVIRECGTGLPQKFHVEDLRKPFIGVRVVYQPDMSDPETRRIMTERALAGTSALYNLSRQLAPAPMPIDDEDVDDDPRVVATTTSATTSEAPADPAAAADYGPIKSIKVDEKKRKADQSVFFKWTVVDHDGAEHVTIQAAIGKVLEKHYHAKTPVRIISEENAYNEMSILEVEPFAGNQGGLPPMGRL